MNFEVKICAMFNLVKKIILAINRLRYIFYRITG